MHYTHMHRYTHYTHIHICTHIHITHIHITYTCTHTYTNSYSNRDRETVMEIEIERLTFATFLLQTQYRVAGTWDVQQFTKKPQNRSVWTDDFLACVWAHPDILIPSSVPALLLAQAGHLLLSYPFLFSVSQPFPICWLYCSLLCNLATLSLGAAGSGIGPGEAEGLGTHVLERQTPAG